jgi:hypothetical protein
MAAIAAIFDYYCLPEQHGIHMSVTPNPPIELHLFPGSANKYIDMDLHVVYPLMNIIMHFVP